LLAIPAVERKTQRRKTMKKQKKVTLKNLGNDAQDRPLTKNETEQVVGGRKAGREQHDYMKVTMEDVLIS